MEIPSLDRLKPFTDPPSKRADNSLEATEPVVETAVAGSNIDRATVEGFGDEWSQYDQTSLSAVELQDTFARYFAIFPWERLGAGAVGFDMGCGSGRWARLVAPRVGRLHCVDASARALEVARRNLAEVPNCVFHLASVDSIPLPDDSMDFGYSLGVLHHIPDPLAGLQSCVRKLRPGAPLLVYLYYALDNRPLWYKQLWRASDEVRRFVSRLPRGTRVLASRLIAAGVYWPLARLSRVLERTGFKVDVLPLSFYRRHSFYTMQTDALDRFGTQLEHRFTADQIGRMMEVAGLEDVRFSESEPFWCAVGFKRGDASNGEETGERVGS